MTRLGLLKITILDKIYKKIKVNSSNPLKMENINI